MTDNDDALVDDDVDCDTVGDACAYSNVDFNVTLDTNTDIDTHTDTDTITITITITLLITITMTITITITFDNNNDNDNDNSTNTDTEPAASGGRYMVVDCGGGTVDITVHEISNEVTVAPCQLSATCLVTRLAWSQQDF